MSKFRYFSLYLYTFFRRYKTFLGIFSIALVLVLIFFIKFHTLIFKKTITEGIVGTFTEGNLPPEVTSLLSDGLVRLDKQSLPKPNLITGWEVNSDATNYTFRLKPDLHWSDGSPLGAEEISVNVTDARINTPDSKTISVKLNDSFSPLPSLLTSPILKKGVLLGLGPYHVASIDKTPPFIRKLKLSSGREDLPDIIIIFYPNEKIATEAIKLGEIQALIGTTQTSEFKEEKPFDILQKTNFFRLVTIFYNTKNSILTDKNFREGLSFGTPSIKGEVAAKTSIPNFSWAFNSDVKNYLNNPESAKSSLEKVKNGRDSTIVLTATNSLEDVGKEIVDAWNRQGIKSTLRVESGIPQNFQALLIAQDIPSDPDQYSLWHSTQSQTNVSKYSGPRVDKDLEDGRKTQDLVLRKKSYQDFQKALLDDAPATFLYFPKYSVVSLKKIEPDLRKVLHIQLRDFGF